ncbi:MAG: methylated-DNA--[protein]-cysteine S-methyltransferase [Proteobacteria bacterium]|nr:MAG: methylated-DNA--[protein]-cysteine S-methyltransferase [Pseudomonadota bacterium]
MKVAQWKMETPVGIFHLVASGRGLRGLYWKEQAAPYAESLAQPGEEIAMLARAVHQLEEYLEGARRVFELPLDPVGTDFQRQVWAELAKIPYGETRSYRDIARAIHNEKAMRAVGAANGKNPISIIVPCHRVIGANGTLTGYAGGLGSKTKLLELERRGLSLVDLHG